MPEKSVVLKGTDVYLNVGRDWYVYNCESQPLGSGSMGTVFLGKNCNNPWQRVAIKLVNPKYADVPSIRNRARTESSLRFNHQNLVQMIGCCELDPVQGKGAMWIISKLVQGINLDEHVSQNLRGKPHATKKIVETMIPVLDALDYLHGGGIMHLDIKPSNIMLEDGRNIRLMDLGIASVGQAGSTQTAGLVGTPQYAAPEQCITPGEPHQEINATTDIYEAGVTLYELLTHTNPYNAPTIVGTMTLHKTLILPEHKDVPKELLAILRKATHYNQKYRYQSAKEFQTALLEILPKLEDKKSFGKWIWILAALFIVILLLALFFSFII